MKKIPVIIDTDPGLGDVNALVMALRSEKLDVKLACSTAGNVSIEKTTDTVLYFVKNYSSKTLVAKGTGKPLKRKVTECEDVFGESGIGSFVVPHGKYKPDYANATVAMHKVLSESVTPVTIVTLGPVTNLAKLLIAHPEDVEKIKAVYAMIASIDGKGNVTPYAEYNCYWDPEALDVVTKSGVNVVFFPKQIGEKTMILQTKFKNHEVTHPYHRTIIEMLDGFTEKAVDPRYMAMYDECAVYALINPKLYDFVNCDFEINLKDKPGQTFMPKNKEGKFKYAVAKSNKELAKAMFNEIYK